MKFSAMLAESAQDPANTYVLWQAGQVYKGNAQSCNSTAGNSKHVRQTGMKKVAMRTAAKNQ